ncbi:extracellular serine-rich protein [Paraphaeosphaeria minitans]|uniref:Extracellular serine-rich protein n=1 Tax=Paraphaeosphaeria minitans TaxID=565426 RepID=A0A9P6KJF7_9PLEO|nr:extracellular serine-rich protein [Paraphaeosphaeria minitans]
MAEVASITSSDSLGSQSATTAPSATETTSSSYSTSSEPKIHLVKVGAGGFQFEPAELTNVSVGDIVTYEFYPLDYSVAQAEYGSACITHWNLTINSTEPIFYYCAAPDSCKGKRMVGAINPNSTQTLDAQIRAAEKADFQVAPGEAVPKEASSTLLAPSTTSSPQVSASANHHHAGLSVAAIVGIVFGGIAFIAFCAAVLFYVARKAQVKGRDATSTQHPASVDTTSSPNVAECPPPFSPFSLSYNHPYEDYPRLFPPGQHPQ